jgi:hypothetical protein
MDLQSVGRIVLVVGILIAVIGGLLMAFGNTPLFRSLGNLPGDIRVEGQGFSCFVPIVSGLLLSVLLTIIVNVIIRLINRP